MRELFTDILVSRAVSEEYGEPLPGWIRVLDVKNRKLVQALLESIHRGEAETIALAIEVKADIVVLDDKRARNIARRLGLRVIGTVGILILSMKQNLIDNIDVEVDKLLRTSFYLSQDVITKALEYAKKDC